MLSTPTQKTALPRLPPQPPPPRPGSSPPASCAALENALRVVLVHIQSPRARAAAKMLLCTNSSVNATE